MDTRTPSMCPSACCNVSHKWHWAQKKYKNCKKTYPGNFTCCCVSAAASVWQSKPHFWERIPIRPHLRSHRETRSVSAEGDALARGNTTKLHKDIWMSYRSCEEETEHHSRQSGGVRSWRQLFTSQPLGRRLVTKRNSTVQKYNTVAVRKPIRPTLIHSELNST